MASIQCFKPAEETRHHTVQSKVSETGSWVFEKEETRRGHAVITTHSSGEKQVIPGHDGGKLSSQTHSWLSQNHAHSNPNVHGVAHTSCHCAGKVNGHLEKNHAADGGATAHGRTHRRRGLFQKIKDRLSGHSDSSSSSSESESDDEKHCVTRQH